MTTNLIVNGTTINLPDRSIISKYAFLSDAFTLARLNNESINLNIDRVDMLMVVLELDPMPSLPKDIIDCLHIIDYLDPICDEYDQYYTKLSQNVNINDCLELDWGITTVHMDKVLAKITLNLLDELPPVIHAPNGTHLELYTEYNGEPELLSYLDSPCESGPHVYVKAKSNRINSILKKYGSTLTVTFWVTLVNGYRPEHCTMIVNDVGIDLTYCDNKYDYKWALETPLMNLWDAN